MNRLVDHGTTTRPGWPMVVAVCVAILLLVVPADASRDLPETIGPTLDVPVVGPSDLDRTAQVRRELPFFSIADLGPFSGGRPHDYDDPSSRFCIYDGPGGLTSPTEGEGFAHPHLFQGLWTDPVTGISYARNRWYDARTASWLSEDPLGDVDSPNLYAFVGWQPHAATDPMGEAVSRSKSGFTVIKMDQGERQWIVSPREALADTQRFREMLLAGGMTALEASEYIVGLSEHEHAFKVVIDPGHGFGGDVGAHTITLTALEKDEALETSFMIRDSLERRHNAEVVMTREGDEPGKPSGPPGNLMRAAFANAEAPDAFVSIHLNSDVPGPNGLEVFYKRRPPDDSHRRLAESVAGHQTVMTPLRAPIDASQEKGVKQADYTVLARTNMPAILVELGFIRTPADLTKIQSQRETIAAEIATGVADWAEHEEELEMLRALGMIR